MLYILENNENNRNPPLLSKRAIHKGRPTEIGIFRPRLPRLPGLKIEFHWKSFQNFWGFLDPSPRWSGHPLWRASKSLHLWLQRSNKKTNEYFFRHSSNFEERWIKSMVYLQGHIEFLYRWNKKYIWPLKHSLIVSQGAQDYLIWKWMIEKEWMAP